MENVLKTCPGKLVVLMKFGSHLYGLNTENSDVDYKGVYIPTLDDVLDGKTHHTYNSSTGDDRSKNTSDDVDIEWISIQKFTSMMARGEVISMDMLHATKDAIIDKSGDWDILVRYREFTYSQDLAGYNGYVRRQAHKYGIKGSRLALAETVLALLGRLDIATTYVRGLYYALGNDFISKNNEYIQVSKIETENPTLHVFDKQFPFNTPTNDLQKSLEKITKNYGDRAKLARDNEGIDWKAMSHAVRVSYQIRDIYTNGRFSFPFKGLEKQRLLQIKLGRLDFDWVSSHLEDLVEENRQMAKTFKTQTLLTKETLFEFAKNAVKREIKKEC